MRVCIFGAGAIGGYLGVALAKAGAEVSLVARGAHLEAMRRDGVRLLKDGAELLAQPRCTKDPGEAEPSGARTARVDRLAGLFEAAGLKAPVLDNIRDEIWLKLWGNLCFNPISALTHATLDLIAADPGTRAVAKAMMLEAKAISDAIGVSFRVDVERRIEGARRVGAHKTSMLQDLERGRAMEIDPLVKVVQELGALTGIPTPTLDTVLALGQQRARI